MLDLQDEKQSDCYKYAAAALSGQARQLEKRQGQTRILLRGRLPNFLLSCHHQQAQF